MHSKIYFRYSWSILKSCHLLLVLFYIHYITCSKNWLFSTQCVFQQVLSFLINQQSNHNLILTTVKQMYIFWHIKTYFSVINCFFNTKIFLVLRGFKKGLIECNLEGPHFVFFTVNPRLPTGFLMLLFSV